MKRDKITSADIRNVAELKRLVIANAVATGNTFAFHDLFSRLKEFADTDDETGVGPTLLEHLAYLLPHAEMAESPRFRAAMELVESRELKGDAVPAALLEEAAKEAVARGKFSYAEDAYRLLGIKKEMVALYAQAGEQFVRDDKPERAATAFFVAASIDQPIGPHYQYLGPELHSQCPSEPEKCLTALSPELLVEAGINFLLPNDALAQRLIAAARPEQRRRVLGALAVCRDMNLPELVSNLRAAAAALSNIENGKPDDYSPIGPMLLGRETGANEPWQFLREFCFEHPVGSLCVCMRTVRNTLVLVPVVRDGKPLIDLLLPPELLPA